MHPCHQRPLPLLALLGLLLWGFPWACAPAPTLVQQPGQAQENTLPAIVLGTPIPFDGTRAHAQLATVVALGPRHPGSPALAELLDTLDEELLALGFKTRRETFSAKVPITPATPKGTQTYTNLVADLPGPAKDSPMILVGGHIDTKFLGENFIGANDGGSSTVALIELARGLASTHPRALAWRVVFFDGEEAINFDWLGKDNTYGSRRHARELYKRGEDKRVGAVVVVDMIADLDLVLTWDDYSTKWLRQIFWTAAKDIGLGKHVATARRRTLVKDDHRSFLDVGLEAVDLIDLDYGGPLRPYWHNDQDTLDKTSAASLETFGQILTKGLVELEAEVLRRRRKR
ncbi:MAG TPA: M28 family peptidase [Planctomycetes bacterium]|nr:M28 family peptidase [Planctomycetota bacterium]